MYNLWVKYLLEWEIPHYRVLGHEIPERIKKNFDNVYTADLLIFVSIMIYFSIKNSNPPLQITLFWEISVEKVNVDKIFWTDMLLQSYSKVTT